MLRLNNLVPSQASGRGQIGKPLPVADADAIFPHVSYSKQLGLYFMVFNVNVWQEYAHDGRTHQKSGIYVAYSNDGVKWSRPEMLAKDYAVCQVGESVSWHPTIVWQIAGHSEANRFVCYRRICGAIGDHRRWPLP